MCGRYTLRTPLQHVLELFSATLTQEQFPFAARFNVAPMQEMPVIHADQQGAPTLKMMRWGLAPSWAEDPAIGNRMINARCETASSRPAFRDAYRRRRCIVPADGFYEWKKGAAGKQPYLVRRRDGKPFAFAGLWERWRRGEKLLESFTILTTTPNRLMRDIHDRMPVILSPRGARQWLDHRQSPEEGLARLLCPCPEDELEATPVSTLVNSPANDLPDCVEPLMPEKAAPARAKHVIDGMPDLFSGPRS